MNASLSCFKEIQRSTQDVQIARQCFLLQSLGKKEVLQGLVPDYMEYCWTEGSQLEFILIVPQTTLSQKCTVISKKQSQYFPTTFLLYRQMGEA